jgi:hypothetical protein
LERFAGFRLVLGHGGVGWSGAELERHAHPGLWAWHPGGSIISSRTQIIAFDYTSNSIPT